MTKHAPSALLGTGVATGVVEAEVEIIGANLLQYSQ